MKPRLISCNQPVDCRLVVVVGVRLPSQNYNLGPIFLSPGDKYVDLVDRIG
jgi:hypothetical protein